MGPVQPRSVGAYGLRIEGVSEAVRRMLGPAGPGWETIELRARIGRTEGDGFTWENVIPYADELRRAAAG